MGTKAGVADALFSKVQQRVLAVLFGNPRRSFYANELIALARSGTGAVQRELTRLTNSGLVTATRIGNQRHYQANRQSPVFDELRGLVVKTVGLVGPLQAALQPFALQIHAAFIYGSVAKATDTVRSDIDLMVLADDLSYADIYPALEQIESVLHRPVNPNVMRPAEWRRKRRDGTR